MSCRETKIFPTSTVFCLLIMYFNFIVGVHSTKVLISQRRKNYQAGMDQISIKTSNPKYRLFLKIDQ